MDESQSILISKFQKLWSRIGGGGQERELPVEEDPSQGVRRNIIRTMPVNQPGAPMQFYAERRATIVKMRADGMTYQAIGRKLGITREAVRQNLHKANRADLMGILKRDRVCVMCGKVREKAHAKGTCSEACLRALGENEYIAKGTRILAMRMQGMSWQAVTEAVGLKVADDRGEPVFKNIWVTVQAAKAAADTLPGDYSAVFKGDSAYRNLVKRMGSLE